MKIQKIFRSLTKLFDYKINQNYAILIFQLSFSYCFKPVDDIFYIYLLNFCSIFRSYLNDVYLPQKIKTIMFMSQELSEGLKEYW